MTDASYGPKVYRKQGGDELVVASGGKITVEAGGELELASGATLDLGDGLSAPADITLADGKIIVGNASGVGAAVTPSGDVTMTNAGVTAIGAGKVTAPMLANGAGIAALVTAGLGASAAYLKTTNGAQTLLASDAAARVALIMAVVTETFADGGGSQTTFTIGETDTADKFAAAAVFTGAQAGDVFFFAGTLTADKALLVTANDAAGAGAGAISVTALVLPAAA